MVRALMRRWFFGALVFVNALGAAPALAAEDVVGLVTETGRRRLPDPEADTFRLLVSGEHQLRFEALRSFPLVATPSAIAARPGLADQSIGQNHFVSHWLRLRPRFQLRDAVEIIGQLDVVTGLLVGDTARGTSADQTPRDTRDGFRNVQPRWLYAEVRLPLALVRLGQQPNHWGMGILTNDGDHPPLFGDHRYGAISERLLVATKPGGKDSPWNVAVAADLVFRDNTVRLTRGDRAVQGVLAAYWEREGDRAGFFGYVRHQTNERPASAAASFDDTLDVVTLDLHARKTHHLPGEPDAIVFAEAEMAVSLGSTTAGRVPAQTLAGERTDVRAYGGAASVGVVHRAAGEVPWGDLAGQVELGYASGDADPYDATDSRFTFDPNHRIGLLLFDEILRFQTARAATAASDPLGTNAGRATAGIDRLPSNGGVFSAQYINPTVICRPRSWLDLKGGMVVAQATSEVVDPYRVAASGRYVNYRGGSSRSKDLGIELDAGVEARRPLPNGVTAQIGAQAGVLFPGNALADASGARLSTPWVAIGRLGLQF